MGDASPIQNGTASIMLCLSRSIAVGRSTGLYGDKWVGFYGQQQGVEIVEGHAMPDHIHLYLSIPLKYSVANTIGFLLGF